MKSLEYYLDIFQICCPVKPQNIPDFIHIQNPVGSLTFKPKYSTIATTTTEEIDFPYAIEGEGTPLPSNPAKFENENLDFEYEDATVARAISPKFTKVPGENQVSFKAHESFRLLPAWKECGLKSLSEKGQKVTFDSFPWIVQIGYANGNINWSSLEGIGS